MRHELNLGLKKAIIVYVQSEFMHYSNLLKSNKCQQVKKQYCNIRLKFIKNTNKYGIYTK